MPKRCKSPKPCLQCGRVWTPYEDATRYCSKRCIWQATKGPAFNARIARESAARRGNAQRNRGAGKAYRKLNGRHEHRRVAEAIIGRPLHPGEVVRFKDGNRRNTAADNLEVVPSQAEHARRTFNGRPQSPEQVRKRMATKQKTLEAKRMGR